MKKEFFFSSKDGVTQIHGIRWIPEGEVIAVLQICHGMAEYIDRYDEFAQRMSEQGILVVGHDHLGHGKSVTGMDKLGYFHHPDGNACVIADIHKLRIYTQKQYPEVPYVMLGHSMGSFLLRQYLGRHREGISGAVIMGTGDQPDLALRSGKLLCRLLAIFRGWEYRSSFVNDLAAGGYEKKLGPAWLSRDEERVALYQQDPLCGFVFTLNSYYHMFDGMLKMNREEKKGNIPREIPLLFVAGAEDPVGECGRGVEKVCERYRMQGAEELVLRLYPKARHELLNERNRETVFEDILCWMKEKILP